MTTPTAHNPAALRTLIEHARKGQLVIFAGAGISMPSPTSLPSWKALNEAVLASLARRLVVFTNDEFATDVLNSLIATRDNAHHFTPDYQAQLIEDECGLEYFRVLQALDTEDGNDCHASVAALAAAGHVAAIVTTNFDRLLERAFDAVGVEYQRFYDHTQYDALLERVTSGTISPLPLIKVHGTVEAPESMVDTLRQRMAGRPEALDSAIGKLLEHHHLLFVGFSGADLAYDDCYLGLRAAAAHNQGFTCLVRTGDQPLPPMISLAKAWGEPAPFISGTLPAWFDDLLATLGLQPVTRHQAVAGTDRIAAVAAHADRWADSLGHMLVVAIIAELLECSGRQNIAFDLLSRTLRSSASVRDMEAPGYSRFNYQLGRRLLELGKFDYAIDWLQGRKVEREGGYSPFTANDCFQCLHRALGASFIHGDIDMGLYFTLRGKPQQGAQQIRAARARAEDAGIPLAVVDACRALGIVYEITMHYADGVDWLGRAREIARTMGDEPRRARVCGELARFLSMKRQFDEAHDTLKEGFVIAERLSLEHIRFELLSAEASVMVEQQRASEACERLTMASAGFRKTGRRPALTRAMVDACYANFQAQDWDGLHEARLELASLIQDYPGYAPMCGLMESRLAAWTGSPDVRGWIEDTKRVAALYENPGVIEEVQILEKKLTAT